MKQVKILNTLRLDFTEAQNSQLALVAVGGDLRVERLLFAYRSGIFPWYSRGEPVCWWSPFPRAVIFPERIRVPRSLRRLANKKIYNYRLDSDFKSVINNCASLVRKGQEGTWIHPEMISAYCRLHQLGFAHSLEVYRRDKLIAGLYGVSLGRIFFGESMFNLEPNTAKLALWKLAEYLRQRNFLLIDCQMLTPLTELMGAELITREFFFEKLNFGLEFPTLKGRWSIDE